MDFAVVVPWFDRNQRDLFLERWNSPRPTAEWLVLQHDASREGTATTKNKGIATAILRGADVVVVLDDDCYPDPDSPYATLPGFAALHMIALRPQPVEMCVPVTTPPSRGMPYHRTTITRPVAASVGFWEGVGDWDAASQLVRGAETKMHFHRRVMYHQYFPMSGMNMAFRPMDWLPWCQFIDVPRFDDIWMGWLWQREAYRRGYCFNLMGAPTVWHSRQSHVFSNLKIEAQYLEDNERVWADIATHPNDDYDSLRALLPVPRRQPGG